MKQILFLLVSLLVLSCSNNPVPKPDNLLDEEVMVDILFDVAVLNAAQSVKPSVLREHNIETQTFIFNKYKIDAIPSSFSSSFNSTLGNLINKKKIIITF